jgi:hypothetical protein
MELRQLNALEAARRVYGFLTTTPLPPPLATMDPSFTQLVQTLGTLITSVDTDAATQIPGNTKSQIAARNGAAKTLRSTYLRPLRKVAQIILKSNAGVNLSPGFPSLIHLPETHNDQALVAAANAVVQNITPYKDLFIAKGMPATFLDQFTAAVNTLVQSAESQRSAKTSQVSATADIDRLLKEIRDTIHLLDINVVRECKADKENGPAADAAWVSAKRIRRATTPTPSSTATPKPTTTVSPTPASPATSATAATSSATTPVASQSTAPSSITSTTPGESHA